MSDLYRLVYASKNLLRESEAETMAAIQQILTASQRNNVKADVTGALMFNAGAFAQVLEGPRRSVEETFERIQCDDRHGDVTVLQCGPTENRGFGNWSMAFTGQSDEGRARFSDLAAQSGFDLSRLDGDAVFAMLHELVLEEEGVRSSDIEALRMKLAEAPVEAGLNVEQLRTEIAQLRPDAAATQASLAAQRIAAIQHGGPRALSAQDATPTLRGATDAALAVLKVALASERQRTSELRAEIDALQITVASHEDRLDAMRDERNLWAERARLLATAIAQDADQIRKAADSADASETRATLRHALA